MGTDNLEFNYIVDQIASIIGQFLYLFCLFMKYMM